MVVGVHVPERPVVGWRYWQVSAGRRLRSVTQKWVEWVPEEPLRARCVEIGHGAPADECACGVYGVADLARLKEHGLCLVPDSAIVLGRVALWGRVVDEHGAYRGELGQPVSLSLVLGTLDDDQVSSVLDGLGRYGVEVGTVDLDEAVAGASAMMLRFQAMSAGTSRSGVEG